MLSFSSPPSSVILVGSLCWKMNDNKVNHSGDSWSVPETKKNKTKQSRTVNVVVMDKSVVTVGNKTPSPCLPAACKSDYTSSDKWKCFIVLLIYIHCMSCRGIRSSLDWVTEQNSPLSSTLTQHRPLNIILLATLVDKPAIIDTHKKGQAQKKNMFSVHSSHNHKINLFLTIWHAYKLCPVKVSLSLDCWATPVISVEG